MHTFLVCPFVTHICLFFLSFYCPNNMSLTEMWKLFKTIRNWEIISSAVLIVLQVHVTIRNLNNHPLLPVSVCLVSVFEVDLLVAAAGTMPMQCSQIVIEYCMNVSGTVIYFPHLWSSYLTLFVVVSYSSLFFSVPRLHFMHINWINLIRFEQ